jgi:hypothetical protein
MLHDSSRYSTTANANTASRPNTSQRMRECQLASTAMTTMGVTPSTSISVLGCCAMVSRWLNVK